MEKLWETIPQGTGAGAQLSINGSSSLVEMGKHMEVLNWRMEDKILSLSVFPFPLCAAHCRGFQAHPAPGNTVRALVALMVLQLLSSACQTGEFAKIRSEK